MSLESARTTKPSILEWCEGRRDLIRSGNDPLELIKRVPESRNNGSNASNHHRSGVGEVGMLGSEIETSREIPVNAEGESRGKVHHKSQTRQGCSVHGEVGMVRSSVDAPVMGCRAKGSYLVDVNREEKDM